MRNLIFAAIAATGVIASGPALADGGIGGGAGGPALFLGSGAKSGAMTSRERGVRIVRGAGALPAAELAGEAPQQTVVVRETKVVVHHYHSKRRTLRTQGFYSGDPTGTRRFTQGFYSGPADRGRRYD